MITLIAKVILIQMLIFVTTFIQLPQEQENMQITYFHF